MTTAQAETLALQALGWMAAQDGLLQVFLGASGLSERDLRTQANDPDLLAAVLDFLLMDDGWITGFCDDVRRPYPDVAAARAALPGGAHVHWT